MLTPPRSLRVRSKPRPSALQGDAGKCFRELRTVWIGLLVLYAAGPEFRAQ
jgi:hypothetical protein